MTIRFLHAADLHLDRPFTKLQGMPEPVKEKVVQSTYMALQKLVRHAIDEGCDFVVFAGDIFDHTHLSVRSQILFKKEMERLRESGIEIFAITGNHDYENQNGLTLDLDGLIHFFGPEPECKVFDKDGTRVHLYGFSYHERHQREAKLDRYIRQEGADFHIGVLHGYDEKGSAHERYAPFSASELAEKGFDYWALGHIHERRALHPDEHIWYTGSSQGLSPKETGVKGVNLVVCEKGATSVTFLPTSAVLWEEAAVEAAPETDFNALYDQLDTLKEDYRDQGLPVLLRIYIKGYSENGDIRQDQLNLELMDALQEGEEWETDFVWPYDIILQPSVVYDRDEVLGSDSFAGELLQIADQLRASQEVPVFEDLYKNSLARKFSRKPTDQETGRILIDAEQMLMGAFLQDKNRDG